MSREAKKLSHINLKAGDTFLTCIEQKCPEHMWLAPNTKYKVLSLEPDSYGNIPVENWDAYTNRGRLDFETGVLLDDLNPHYF